MLSSELDPPLSMQEFSSIASSTPAEGGMRLASDSRQSLSVTRNRTGNGACDRDFETNVAKSPPGGLRGLKPCRRLWLAFDAIDTKSSPILPSDVPGNQIPAISRVDEAVRFDGSRAGGPAAVVVLEPNSFVVAACAGNHR